MGCAADQADMWAPYDEEIYQIGYKNGSVEWAIGMFEYEMQRLKEELVSDGIIDWKWSAHKCSPRCTLNAANCFRCEQDEIKDEMKEEEE